MSDDKKIQISKAKKVAPPSASVISPEVIEDVLPDVPASLPPEVLDRMKAQFEAQRIMSATEILKEDLTTPIGTTTYKKLGSEEDVVIPQLHNPGVELIEEERLDFVPAATSGMPEEPDTSELDDGDEDGTEEPSMNSIEEVTEEVVEGMEELEDILNIKEDHVPMTEEEEAAPSISIQVDEAPTQEAAPVAKETDDVNCIYVALSNEENLTALFAELMNKYGGEKAFHKALMEREELPYSVARVYNDITHQSKFASKALALAVREGKMAQLIEIEGRKVRDGIASKNLLKGKVSGSRISSNEAIKLAMAASQGIMKVHFYNSGFYVNIRPPVLVELNQLYNTIRSSGKEYEKEFGALYHLPFDKKIKEAIMELFTNLVIDSNLHNYDKPGVLMDALAFPDHVVAMWAMSCLMFKEGAKIRYVCAEHNCGHVHNTTIDISKMRMNNYRLVSAEQVMFTNSATVRTLEDLAKYRMSLKLEEKVVLDEQWSLKLDTCVMSEWFAFANEFNSKLLSQLQDTSEESIANYYESAQNRIVAPWTKEVIITENGIEGIIADKSVFAGVLDALQLHESKIIQKEYARLTARIEDYIQKISVSHICYSFNKCPKCGKIPSSAVNNLIACDVQSTFFTLLIMRLTRR